MSESPQTPDELVPDSVIPHHTLPPLRYRDLPEAPHWRKLVGPSIILAGLALGSGEFVFWPYITYKAGFVFFWACVIGVITQYFMNLEIERWTLLTGETAITGFCRMSRLWAPVLLVMNVVPWIWPGWATGAAMLISWLCFGVVEQPLTARTPTPAETTLVAAYNRDHSGEEPSPLSITTDGHYLQWVGPLSQEQEEKLRSRAVTAEDQQAAKSLIALVRKTGGIKHGAHWVPWISIVSLWLIGLLLTSSPVVYNTVEQMQSWLVGLIFIAALSIGALVIRPDAWVALWQGIWNLGEMPPASAGLEYMALLGALAFAGVGGTLNLGQSNFIRDKGFGMGHYIGRITSPLTGQEEPIADVGYHFPHTPENMRRWRDWWRAANIEHFFSFGLTCGVSLILLTLISYSLFYAPDGTLLPGMDRFGQDLDFVWGEAQLIRQRGAALGLGTVFQTMFLLMGVALLLTTELGVLDATARISSDLIKVNLLRDHPRWTLARLYFVILWSEILLSTGILLSGVFLPGFQTQPLFLLKTSAALNGLVMCLYSLALLYLNTKVLPRNLAIGPGRFVMLVWAIAFFGYFSLQALQHEVWPWLTGR